MSAEETNDPSAAKNAMLSGSGVSRIQKFPVVGSSQRKTIPSAPLRSVTPIRPCARSAGVAASHRQTSHVDPVGGRDPPGDLSKPSGATPAVVGAGAVAVGTALTTGAVGAVGLLPALPVAWSLAATVDPPPRAVRRGTGAVVVAGRAGGESTTASTAVHDRHDIAATVRVGWAACPTRRRARAAAPRTRCSTRCTASTSRRPSGTRRGAR